MPAPTMLSPTGPSSPAAMQDSADPPPDSLTPRQQIALIALLRNRSVAAAARECGLAERTLWYYMKQPPFRHAFLGTRLLHTDEALRCMEEAATTGMETLQRNLKCGDPAVEVRAAIVLFKAAMQRWQWLQQTEADAFKTVQEEEKERSRNQSPWGPFRPSVTIVDPPAADARDLASREPEEK